VKVITCEKANRRSLQESQQQLCPASAAAEVDISVSDAEDKLAGEVGGPANRS